MRAYIDSKPRQDHTHTWTRVGASREQVVERCGCGARCTRGYRGELLTYSFDGTAA